MFANIECRLYKNNELITKIPMNENQLKDVFESRTFDRVENIQNVYLCEHKYSELSFTENTINEYVELYIFEKKEF